MGDVLVLDKSKMDDVEGIVNCLVESFVGYEKDGNKFRDPMVHVLDVDKGVFKEFIRGYIEEVWDQGYCFYMKDEEGCVVGASIGDTFAPTEEVEYVGDEKFDVIVDILHSLDVRWLRSKRAKGEEVKDGDYLHSFMLGVKDVRKELNVSKNLVDKTIDTAKEDGKRGILCEVSNRRPFLMLTHLYGFKLAKDENGNNIEFIYRDSEMFKEVPKKEARGSQVLERIF